MSFQMNLDDMLNCIRALDDAAPATNRATVSADFTQRMEALGDEMAAIIAVRLGVQAGATSWDMGSTCCPFFPAFKGQDLPAVMEDADDGGAGDWVDDFDTAPDLPEGFKDWPFPMEGDGAIAPNELLEVLMPDGQRATGKAVEAIRIPGIRAWRKVETNALPEGFTAWPFPTNSVGPGEELEFVTDGGIRARGRAIDILGLTDVIGWRKVEDDAPATEESADAPQL